MHDDEYILHIAEPDPPELDAVYVQLANGHHIRIEARFWSPHRTYEDWSAGHWPEPRYAIRIHCTQDTLPRRMVWREEIRHLQDFHLRSILEIWGWLQTLSASREMLDFHGFEQFLDRFIDEVHQQSMPFSDAVDHIRFLPTATTAPIQQDHCSIELEDEIYAFRQTLDRLSDSQ